MGGPQWAGHRHQEGEPVIITLDTEFIEDGVTIDLLSIGLVRADGEEYYAEPAETDRSRANPWVEQHALPYLTGPVKPRAQIAAEITAFAGPSPKFWAWYAAYDWVALCQLYGAMLDLPKSFPMYVRDFRQAVVNPADLPKQGPEDGPEHHALADARWLMRCIKTVVT